MLEATGQETGTFDHLFAPVTTETPEHHPGGTTNGGVEPRHAQASFVFALAAIARDERRVDERKQLGGIAPCRNIRDEDSQAHSDLRRRQPDSRRRIHRLDHVIDELLDLRGDFRNRRGGLMEELFPVSKNGPDQNTFDL
jgi:hypothetical protein